jgi:hypothetical protein
VERYLAVGQGCHSARISLDEHNMVALFGEHDGSCEPNVPCPDYGHAQVVSFHALMLADAGRPDRLVRR